MPGLAHQDLKVSLAIPARKDLCLEQDRTAAAGHGIFNCDVRGHGLRSIDDRPACDRDAGRLNHIKSNRLIQRARLRRRKNPCGHRSHNGLAYSHRATDVRHHSPDRLSRYHQPRKNAPSAPMAPPSAVPIRRAVSADDWPMVDAKMIMPTVSRATIATPSRPIRDDFLTGRSFCLAGQAYLLPCYRTSRCLQTLASSDL